MPGSVARKDWDLQRRLGVTVESSRLAYPSGTLSQGELARKVGISQAALSQIESGRRMDISTLNRVAGALGMRLSELIREAEETGDAKATIREAERFARRYA